MMQVIGMLKVSVLRTQCWLLTVASFQSTTLMPTLHRALATEQRSVPLTWYTVIFASIASSDTQRYITTIAEKDTF